MWFSRNNSGRNLKNPESAFNELLPRASPQPGRRGREVFADGADMMAAWVREDGRNSRALACKDPGCAFRMWLLEMSGGNFE